jgi:hypothetical protein
LVRGDHYDDGGLSGASLDRPAVQNLLTDVRAGKITVAPATRNDDLVELVQGLGEPAADTRPTASDDQSPRGLDELSGRVADHRVVGNSRAAAPRPSRLAVGAADG